MTGRLVLVVVAGIALLALLKKVFSAPSPEARLLGDRAVLEYPIRLRVFAVVAHVGVTWVLWRAASGASGVRFVLIFCVGVIVWVVFFWFLVDVFFRRLLVDPQGLEEVFLGKSKRTPWDRVRSVSLERGRVVVVDAGPPVRRIYIPMLYAGVHGFGRHFLRSAPHTLVSQVDPGLLVYLSGEHRPVEGR